MSGNPPKVVVIEDERPIQRFLRASLMAHGYDVIEAGTGADGLRQAADHQPDAVILDLGLPDMDGMEIIRLIGRGFRSSFCLRGARKTTRSPPWMPAPMII
jgi:two-component system KDP operon response regulator KdpE